MDYTQAMILALNGLSTALKLVTELKGQSGMTDDQLLELAQKNGVELRSDIAAYIASLK